MYRKVFRAIHHVEKVQPPMVPYLFFFFYLERSASLMMLRSAVRSARGKLGLGWDRIVRSGPSGVIFWPSLPYPPALMLMLGDRHFLLRSTAVTPERKGSTRALVLRRGGRTNRGLAPG